MEDRYRLLERLVAENAGVDLHLHSVHSDGEWPPEGLADDVYRHGGAILALTDHDTLAGVPAVLAAAAARRMAAIAGVEVSIRLDQKPYHILCYDVDPAAPVWIEFAALRREHARRYYRAIFDELSRRGYAVAEEAAVDQFGELVAHPVTTALWRSGHAPTREAATRLLSDLRIPLPHHLLALEAEELGAIFRADGGLAVVAHPARVEPGVSTYLTDADLQTLRRLLPIAGLEAYHPYHSPGGVEAMLALARAHDLAVTTGSDAHGHRVRRPPRPQPADRSAAFLRLVLERWRDSVEAAA